MFDQFTATQRRLTLEAYQGRCAELKRRLDVLARGTPARGNAQRDYYELQRLVELVQQPPRLSRAGQASSEHLAEYAGERVFARDADL